MNYCSPMKLSCSEVKTKLTRFIRKVIKVFSLYFLRVCFFVVSLVSRHLETKHELYSWPQSIRALLYEHYVHCPKGLVKRKTR